MGLRGRFDLKHKRTRTSKRRGFKARSLLWFFVLILLWLGYREVKSYFLKPQAILVLGGTPQREDFAAEFARQHPDIPIWVSGGSPPEYTESVFEDAGISLSRLYVDRDAVDTVTNFTTLVDKFQARGIHSVYLITSDYHMRRARIIGELVFGSRGIEFKPVPMPSNQATEPLSKAIRDGARAILWLTTGRTGSTLVQRFDDR
ncbi:YdcF family protein [Phormidium sp. FACHB-592]|nr:YdcF family protein [Leptolyngbya sp. FACHB-321]MBD2075780.1 YdcF family protein [Phormidium sp. FACHB-592]